jgi:predicted  nucleic acid-binding Zn-ribbon protein
LDVQEELFKVYKDSLPSPEQPRNQRSSPSEVEDSLATVGSDSVLDRLSRTTTDSQIVDLQQKLDQQVRENERLRKELDEEKIQRQALEEDHKLQDDFIKALEKQLSEIKLSSESKCQSLEKDLAESNELLEECRSLLLEVHKEQP